MKETDDLISLVAKIGSLKSREGFTNEDANRTLCGLFSYRGIERSCMSAPNHFFETLFSLSKSYDKAVLPVDPIQIREILEGGTVYQDNSIVLFSPQAAYNIVGAYKTFIIIDTKGIEDCNVVGGAIILDDRKLDISDRILGIKISRRGPEKQVREMVSAIDPSIPVHNDISPPGMERMKVAQTEGQSRKFKIVLPPLKIVTEVFAKNEFDAVKRALAIRWDRHPDSKLVKKPARYQAEYWLHSGFWDEIVKTSSSDRLIKTAQAEMPRLELTADEQQVFQTILAIDQQFGLGQQYRVAGGWVRDRILGTQSDDIDIALDKMTGQEFRKYAEQYAQQNQNSGIGKSYVVEQNADASKHLETTAIQFGPFKIDFVNLRTEDYASDSRIPEMKFGTPEEDAQRRDLTINAMFYNIATGQIEDHVGGLEDIKSLTLKTPLDSTQTFEDDPLRMLRVLRFHSRYEGSTIAPETLQGMSDPRVHEAYRQKVSPERAGPEIMKLFDGATPEESLRVLYHTGMDAALLNLPDFQNLHSSDMDQRNPHHELNWLEHTLKVVKNLNQLMDRNGIEGKDRSLALMASWFHDFGKLHPDIGKPKDDNPEHYSYHGHEDESAKLSESFLKSIGIGGDDRQIVNMIVQQHMMPHSYGDDWNKRQMGKFRQKTTIPGQENRSDLWKFVMWHAQADAAAKSESTTLDDVYEYGDRFQQMQDYMDTPPPVKSLVDGRRIIELFPTLNVKDGFIKVVQQRLVEEQGAGNINTPAEAEMFIENIRPEIESNYGGGQVMSSSWYKKIKADASSGSSTDGYGTPQQGEDPEIFRHDGEKRMIYYDNGENSKYRVGDRVRRRQGGMAFQQSDGKIIKKKNNKIVVKWDGGGEDSFDINEVETQAFIERI